MLAIVGMLAAMSLQVREFSYDEAQLLLKVAQAESGNQGEDGMWLTMSCIVNRAESDYFPDSISEVVYQEGQFATVESGAINDVDISPECHLALARIEAGDVAEKIIAFENKRSSYLDKYFSRAFEFKDHRFYTNKIKGGRFDETINTVKDASSD